MSRPIKFRVWVETPDGENGMYYPKLVSFGKDGILSWATLNDDSIIKDNGWYTRRESMQYIGHKDLNGKEIYEGDICRQYWEGHEIIAPIVWNNNKMQFGMDAEVDFDPGTDHVEISVPHTNTAPEVIGNIYENPELLK